MQNSVLYRTMAFSVAMMIAAAAAIGLSLWQSHNDTIEDTKQTATNVATMLAGQVGHSVRSIDLVLDQMLEHLHETEYRGPAALKEAVVSKKMFDFMMERLGRLPQAESMTITAADGEALVSTRGWPTDPRNLADRDYFIDARDNRKGETFVSAPTFARTTGTWTMFFARRIETKSGEYLGVLTIGTHPKHFLDAYSSISLIPGAAAILARKDGTVYLRHPDATERVGEKMPANIGWHAQVAKGGGVYRSTGVFSGESRQAAVKPLTNYPMVVSVAISENSALAVWRERAKITIFGGLALAGLMIWLLRQLYKNFKKTAESEGKLDAAVAHMPQGLVMFDQNHNIVMHNARFCEMYSLSARDLSPGTHRNKLLELRIANNTNPIDEHENYFPLDSDELTAASARVDNLKDGRVILVTRRPVQSGGWVTTHEDITENRKAEARIAHMAHHDALTGLPNRVLFREKLEDSMASAQRGVKVAILCLDLDHFKSVNDTLGHPIGDALLKVVASRLKEHVRDTDTIARLGGDEFAVIQFGLTHEDEAATLSQRLIDSLSAPYEIDGHRVIVGTSIGIAIAPDDSVDPDQLLKSADLALYRSKLDGRGVFRYFEAQMDAKMQARRTLELDLRAALAAKEFEVHYQPFVNLKTNEVSGFEALLRWNHPTRGRVAPSDFIPLAEEIGVIGPIGAWVLTQACAEALTWPDNMRIAVNLSPAQFKSRTLVLDVAAALANSGLSPRRLELEITETVMLQDTDATLATLNQLRDLGVRISMDDFGTGYSSLSYLRRFPFDKIKIDQSFVRDLETKGDAIAIIRAVTGLGVSLGMSTTAEGVENVQQLDMLRDEGCTEVQGFLFSQAIRGGETLALIESIKGKARAAA